jgi:hypothetical protein
MINQEREKAVVDRAVDFCINILKYNKDILLFDLVGNDLLARDFINKRLLVEQMSM